MRRTTIYVYFSTKIKSNAYAIFSGSFRIEIYKGLRAMLVKSTDGIFWVTRSSDSV